MAHPPKPPVQPLRLPYAASLTPVQTQAFGAIAAYEPAVLNFWDGVWGWVWEAGATPQNMHTGVDWGMTQGTPILAAAAGRVVATDPPAASYGFGNLTVVEHSGGLLTFYAHQAAFGCAVGQQLGAGQQLGTVGSTGNSSGPHLHFACGMRDGYGYYCFVDPAPYLAAGEPEPEYPTGAAYRVLVQHYLRVQPATEALHGPFVTVGQVLTASGGAGSWTTHWRGVAPDGLWAYAPNLALA
jgi:murein DD-endopeptidase MepM/ murein hydrolase activator NlpD